MKYGTISCLSLMLVALGDLPSEPPGGLGGDSRRWLAWLRESRGGKVGWGLGAFTLVLGALAVAARLGAPGLNVPFRESIQDGAQLSKYAFLAVSAFVFGPALVLFARDVAVALLRWLPLPRARLGLAAFAGFGLVLSLGYYPRLADQLSPRNVFESFRQRAKPGEPLAVMGQSASVAPYYAGTEVHTPRNVRGALDFLLEAPEQRRWLLLGAKDLGALNQLYRQSTTPPRNLPILDAISSEVLLASNQLTPDEMDENPLSKWVLPERPTPAHPLDVDLNGQLRCLGWALTDPNGAAVAEARTGEPYVFRIYYEVLASVSEDWKTFIHIDNNRRRYNGDHNTLEGKYPFRFWKKGDFVMDAHRVEFEPYFAGATYEVYFGLYTYGENRMPVKNGQHSANRIAGGPLVIR
jgi:hypothetical protein